MTLTESKKEYEKIVIVLDNDECLGFWGIASAIYEIYASYVPVNTNIPTNECLKVIKNLLVKHYLENGGARPGTKKLLKILKTYKDIGIVDKVVMFTSSRNNNNWVDSLKDMLEEYSKTKDLYDLVINRDNTYLESAPDGSTLKNVDIVLTKLNLNKENTKIIILDDKPQNIKGTNFILGISPYRHIVDDIHIKNIIDESLDILDKLYKVKEGEKTFKPSLLNNLIKHSLLIDENGIKKEIRDNLAIYKCSINQLDDTQLNTEIIKD